MFSCLCFRCFLVTFSLKRLTVPISPPASSSRDCLLCVRVDIHIVPVESIFGSFLTCFYCCSYSKMILILSFKSKFLSFTKGRFSRTNINKITLCVLNYYFIILFTKTQERMQTSNLTRLFCSRCNILN